MGYFIQIPEDQSIVERLKANPGSFFSKSFPGYMIFLFDRFDRPWPDYVRDNLTALDQETGSHVAFAMFAITTTLTVRPVLRGSNSSTKPWERNILPPITAEFSPEDMGFRELKNDFDTQRIIGSGAFGWLKKNKETNIEAINSAVRYLSEQFNVKHRMPCIIVMDAIPSAADDFKVIELSRYKDDPDALCLAVRKAVGIFRNHPRYSSYRDAVARLRLRSDELSDIEIESEEMIPTSRHAKTVFEKALKRGDATVLKGFLDSEVDPTGFFHSIYESECPKLNRLKDDLAETARWKTANWPLTGPDRQALEAFLEREWNFLSSYVSMDCFPEGFESQEIWHQWVGELGTSWNRTAKRIRDSLYEHLGRERVQNIFTSYEWERYYEKIRILKEDMRVDLTTLTEGTDRPSWSAIFKACVDGIPEKSVEPTKTFLTYWLEGQLSEFARSLRDGRVHEVASGIEKSFGTGVLSRAPTVFISYSSKDERKVKDWQAILKTLHGDVFRDKDSLLYGEKWEERIEHEISKRDLFYLFWSKNAAESDPVRKEIALAKKLKKKILPINIPTKAPPPEDLKDIHFGNS